jgi:hypothetical protein
MYGCKAIFLPRNILIKFRGNFTFICPFLLSQSLFQDRSILNCIKLNIKKQITQSRRLYLTEAQNTDPI